MKGATVMILVACVVLSGTSAAFAAETPKHASGQILHDRLSEAGLKFRDQLIAIMAYYQGVAEANKQIKAAGATYQKTLAADPDAVSHYTTVKQQAIMAGIYLFDAAYAALFLKKKDMATFLKARKILNEKIGYGAALSPKMKKLLKAPESIRDYRTWAVAINESMSKILNDGLTTDKRLAILADSMYGTIVESLYIVCESIAQADYAPDMLALLNQQKDRLHMLMKMLNVFRGDKAFETHVDLAERFDLLENIHSLLMVEHYTKREVDGIRELVVTEREAIIRGEVGGTFGEF